MRSTGWAAPSGAIVSCATPSPYKYLGYLIGGAVLVGGTIAVVEQRLTRGCRIRGHPRRGGARRALRPPFRRPSFGRLTATSDGRSRSRLARGRGGVHRCPGCHRFRPADLDYRRHGRPRFPRRHRGRRDTRPRRAVRHGDLAADPDHYLRLQPRRAAAGPRVPDRHHERGNGRRRGAGDPVQYAGGRRIP